MWIELLKKIMTSHFWPIQIGTNSWID